MSNLKSNQENNLRLCKRLFNEVPGDVRIDKLIWIAACEDDNSLKDLGFGEVEIVQRDLPEINNPYLEEYINNGELLQLFIDQDRLGFIAQLRCPEIKEINLDSHGSVTSYSPKHWCCLIKFCYAETLDDLTDKIISIGEAHLHEAVTKHKKGAGDDE